MGDRKAAGLDGFWICDSKKDSLRSPCFELGILVTGRCLYPSGRPNTWTGLQSGSSLSGSPKLPSAKRPNPFAGGSSATSMRTQSPEKQPILFRLLTSTYTRASSSSSGAGFGCSSSEGIGCASPCALKRRPLGRSGRAVVAVKLENTEPGVVAPFVLRPRPSVMGVPGCMVDTPLGAGCRKRRSLQR